MILPELPEKLKPEFFEGEVKLSEDVEEDILDDNMYCIQEAKLLTEEDNKKNLAEKKRHKVLQQVKRLRDEFEKIKLRNSTVDENAKLINEELEIDPAYTKTLHDRVAELLEETVKELEWDKVFHKIKTEKLKKYVIDELEVDRFTLKAINTKHTVTTFKVKKKGQFLIDNLSDIYRLIEEEGEGIGQDNLNNTTQTLSPIKSIKRDSGMSPGMNDQSALMKTLNKGNKSLIQTQKMDQTQDIKEEKKQDLSATRNITNATHGGGDKLGTTGEHAEHKYEKYDREKVKQAEAERTAQLEKIQASEPSSNSFDPDHMRLINEAIENLGDYKLKSSKDYIVPENQRINVGKKKKHMFLLEEFIYNTKMKYNNEILNLRKQKLNIIDKVERYNKRIGEINKELNIEEKLISPKIDEELEIPENYLEINDKVVDEYAKKIEEEKAAKNAAFSMNASPDQQKIDVKLIENKPAVNAKDDKKDAGMRDRKGKKIQVSELENEIKLAYEIKLRSEKKTLVEEMTQEIEDFDKEITKYQGIKNILESDMKIAEMKLITHYQELLILNDMEDRDNQLISKLFECRKEKAAHQLQSKDIDSQKSEKKKEEINVERELSDIISKYNQSFPDDITKANKIYGFYQKQYKRRKNREMNRKKDNDDEENEDDYDFSDESIEESDDDDEKVDISAVDSDPNLKDLVERRLQLDDKKQTLLKDISDFERQFTIINNKLGTIEKELKKVNLIIYYNFISYMIRRKVRLEIIKEKSFKKLISYMCLIS